MPLCAFTPSGLSAHGKAILTYRARAHNKPTGEQLTREKPGRGAEHQHVTITSLCAT